MPLLHAHNLPPNVEIMAEGTTGDAIFFLAAGRVCRRGKVSVREIAITGVACSIIAERSPQDAAIVATGDGPRTRIYCLYDDAAIEGADAKEDALGYAPLQGDWALSLPCSADDFDWVQRALKAKSLRITARDQAQTLGETDDRNAKSAALVLDAEAFLKS